MPNQGYALNELQAAVYTALSSDAAISAMTAAVTDWTSDTTPFPFIQLGADTAIDFDSLSFFGQDHTMTIHTWDRPNATSSGSNGRKTIKTLMGHVYRVLHLAQLTMPTQRMVRCRCEYNDTSLDPDGVTYHGVQRFRIITQGV